MIHSDVYLPRMCRLYNVYNGSNIWCKIRWPWAVFIKPIFSFQLFFSFLRNVDTLVICSIYNGHVWQWFDFQLPDHMSNMKTLQVTLNTPLRNLYDDTYHFAISYLLSHGKMRHMLWKFNMQWFILIKDTIPCHTGCENCINQSSQI